MYYFVAPFGFYVFEKEKINLNLLGMGRRNLLCEQNLLVIVFNKLLR